MGIYSFFADLSRVIGESLMPAMTKAAMVLREIYNSWPGMPYTAPSLWDADQMIGDRPTAFMEAADIWSKHMEEPS